MKKHPVIVFLAVLLLAVSQLPVVTTTAESLLIDSYHSKIKNESYHVSGQNDWPSVKLVHLTSVIQQCWHSDATYSGAVLLPSLKVNVPLADYTDNSVYTLGAGMLLPRRIADKGELVIGAHNLGSHSNALFSPLAQHRLSGRTVLITNFRIVKEYRITRTLIISPSAVDRVFTGQANSLTLVTCTPDNRKRILVRAHLVKEYPLHGASRAVQNSLQHKYQYSSIRAVN